MKPTRTVGLRVGDKDQADRAIFMLYRAAVLCGVPSLPPSATDLAKVFGRYNRKQRSDDYLDLRAEGTFTMKAEGATLGGNYTIIGGTLTLSSQETDPLKTLIIDNKIMNFAGIVQFEKRADPLRSSETTEAVIATPNPAPPSASAPSSKMTNGDIIKLIKAGLSEQVIVTSIRQAPAKDFDLSPTGLIALKEASVSDAVIVVMQEGSAPVRAASVSEPKTPPKYDPTLTQPVKSPTDNRCSGIESLGLYKNEIMSGAVGGGLVEWLAKIRNNTNVSKIVVFGWRDMYGQQKKAQVQIRGGDIATPRLDMTQARVIPPVADLRVLSCQ